MTENSEPPLRNGKRKRYVVAIVLSSIILFSAAFNLHFADKNPLSASLPDFGQWLSGVAGALAFVWLIVGYLQQGEELELQREELRLTREEMARLADQAEKQANSAVEQQKTIANTELHQRRDTFARMADLMLPELSAICLQFYSRFWNPESIERLWARVGAGDKLYPVQELARIIAAQRVDEFRSGYIDRNDGMAALAPKMNRFCEVFEQLIRGAHKAEPDGDLLRYYERSGLRTVYGCFCEILERSPMKVQAGPPLVGISD